MSRIRTVKGKITEIIGGDLQYYSEADIVESSAKTYSEKSTKTILHNGNPGKYVEPNQKQYQYPILILQGSRRKGKNRKNDGTANDMLYKDYPENSIGFQRLRNELYSETYSVDKQENWYNYSSREDNATNQANSKIEKIKNFCKKSDSELFDIFRDDIKGFAMGELENVAVSMVDAVKSNKGGVYNNINLTNAVIAHQNSQNFISAIKTNIQQYLSQNKGEISGLEIKDDSKGILYDMLVEDNVSSPKFSDKFGGLGITINDVWAYQVYITYYKTTNNHFQMNLNYIYWDHFGLCNLPQFRHIQK